MIIIIHMFKIAHLADIPACSLLLTACTDEDDARNAAGDSDNRIPPLPEGKFRGPFAGC